VEERGKDLEARVEGRDEVERDVLELLHDVCSSRSVSGEGRPASLDQGEQVGDGEHRGGERRAEAFHDLEP
jgi:hypothetical protein